MTRVSQFDWIKREKIKQVILLHNYVSFYVAI